MRTDTGDYPPIPERTTSGDNEVNDVQGLLAKSKGQSSRKSLSPPLWPRSIAIQENRARPGLTGGTIDLDSDYCVL
ncbi:unnamed protein product [Heligmosomoides polygyrus]|uniref:Uncharacterized protein n=1 Tax=Heligmosomoides polygyrus TaxID=6339 RepID=A0A183FM12_HELPZ|nr:unnamed protein product [Heligmosomoides polygyrus]